LDNARKANEAVVGIAEVISALKLVLDVFVAGGSALRERKDGDLLHPGLLTETYEKLQYFRKAVRDLRITLIGEYPAGEPYDVQHSYLWENFFTTLRNFTVQVSDLNLSVLSIYDPEIGRQLEEAFGIDSVIYHELEERAKYYEAKQGPKPPKRDLKKMRELNDRLGVIYWDISDAEVATRSDQKRQQEGYVPPDGIGTLGHFVDPNAEQTRADVVQQLSALEELLNKLSEQLATFIRGNWTPKDLS
jgi:hypothetical protein